MFELDRLRATDVRIGDASKKLFKTPLDYKKFDNQWGIKHILMLYDIF